MRTDWPLGAALKQARIKSGISARAAAKRAGISSGRWYQLETGVQKAGGQEIPIGTTPTTVYAAAKAVDWDVNEALRLAGFDPRDIPAEPARSPLDELTDDELVDELRDRLRRRAIQGVALAGIEQHLSGNPESREGVGG